MQYAILIIIILQIFSLIKNKQIMSTQTEFKELLNRLDAATTEIAADLQSLHDKIVNDSVSPEDMDTLKADIARLEKMGQDEPGDTPPVEG